MFCLSARFPIEKVVLIKTLLLTREYKLSLEGCLTEAGLPLQERAFEAPEGEVDNEADDNDHEGKLIREQQFLGAGQQVAEADAATEHFGGDDHGPGESGGIPELDEDARQC